VVEGSRVWRPSEPTAPRSPRTPHAVGPWWQFVYRAALGGLLVGLLALGVPSNVGAAPNLSWSVMTSPDVGAPPQQDYLEGISCISTSSCTAVGGYRSGGSPPGKTLVERWNGTNWSVVPSPNGPSGTNVNELNDVSCVSATACEAVGDVHYGPSNTGVYKTLAESWNGARWSVVASGKLSAASNYDTLFGVSCSSADACTAVGEQGSTGSAIETLVESWNGTTWSVVPSPEGYGSDYSLFQGVSCPSSKACTAAGMYRSPSGVYLTLVESWNGTAWSIVPSPDAGPFGDYNDFYGGVSCPSVNACTAVGYYSYGATTKTLVENWRGKSWSIVPSPEKGSALLKGVSCASASSCTAVGANDRKKTFVQSWNGTAWSVSASPDEGLASDGNLLVDVSCALVNFCVAVGYNQFGLGGTSGVDHSLVETSRSTVKV
jgi:hypothetical protein